MCASLLIHLRHFSNFHYYNGVRLPDGRVPTVSDVAKNSALSGNPADLSAEAASGESTYLSSKWMKEIGDDIYKAHAVSTSSFFLHSHRSCKLIYRIKHAIEAGLDDWSEWGYIHNKMGKSINATEFATGKYLFHSSMLESANIIVLNICVQVVMVSPKSGVPCMMTLLSQAPNGRPLMAV